MNFVPFRNIFYLLIVLMIHFVNCTEFQEDLNKVEYNDPIKIAFIGPFSQVRMGAEGKFLGAYLALEEINKNGGIFGRDIEIIKFDDAGSAEVGKQAAREIKKSGISIIIGADWSSVTLGIAEYSIPNNMLLISYSSTNPKITYLEDNNLVWRTPPSDAFQGMIGAKYCFNILNKETASVLYFDNQWALDLSSSFIETFESLGGTIINKNIYPELTANEIAQYDFTSHLDSIFNGKPEIIYIAAFASDGAKITNDIALNNYISEDYQPVFFSNDGLNSDNFLINGHQDIMNGFIGTVPGASENNANYKKYTENYLNRWEFDPVAFSEHAYDAIYLLAYALLKANGSTDTYEIASELRGVSGGIQSKNATEINVNEFAKAREIILNEGMIDYNGASGEIDFNENGDPGAGTYLIWRIKNNQYITDTIINFP